MYILLLAWDIFGLIPQIHKFTNSNPNFNKYIIFIPTLFSPGSYTIITQANKQRNPKLHVPVKLSVSVSLHHLHTRAAHHMCVNNQRYLFARPPPTYNLPHIHPSTASSLISLSLPASRACIRLTTNIHPRFSPTHVSRGIKTQPV